MLSLKYARVSSVANQYSETTKEFEATVKALDEIETDIETQTNNLQLVSDSLEQNKSDQESVSNYITVLDNEIKSGKDLSEVNITVGGSNTASVNQGQENVDQLMVQGTIQGDKVNITNQNKQTDINIEGGEINGRFSVNINTKGNLNLSDQQFVEGGQQAPVDVPTSSVNNSSSTTPSSDAPSTNAPQSSKSKQEYDNLSQEEKDKRAEEQAKEAEDRSNYAELKTKEAKGETLTEEEKNTIKSFEDTQKQNSDKAEEIARKKQDPNQQLSLEEEDFLNKYKSCQ